MREVLEEAEDEAEDGEDDDGRGQPRKKGGAGYGVLQIMPSYC